MDSGNPWNPKPETISKVMATLKGVHGVLKAGGTFISVTFGQVSKIVRCVVSLLMSIAVIDSNLSKIHASHISGALYLMHQISTGLLSGLLLVKPFTILSMF